MRDESLHLFLKITLFRMTEHYMPKLIRCLEVIDNDILWAKDNKQNSIGGITLHICEHINRHTNKYLNPVKSEYSTGIENYFPEEAMTPPELMIYVQERYKVWEEGMKNLLHNDLIDVDMNTFYHLVEHNGYHLGQIVDRVQRITGISLNFCQNGINEKSLREKIDNFHYRDNTNDFVIKARKR